MLIGVLISLTEYISMVTTITCVFLWIPDILKDLRNVLYESVVQLFSRGRGFVVYRKNRYKQSSRRTVHCVKTRAQPVQYFPSFSAIYKQTLHLFLYTYKLLGPLWSKVLRDRNEWSVLKGNNKLWYMDRFRKQLITQRVSLNELSLYEEAFALNGTSNDSIHSYIYIYIYIYDCYNNGLFSLSHG